MDRLTRLAIDAQQGDRSALRQFIAETQHDVASICRYLGDRDTADDLAQETYERAIKSLHRFRADGPAKHWLLTIARRTCADGTRSRIRRRAMQQRVVTFAHDDLVESPVDAYHAELDELMGILDDDRRAAFVLTQLTGLRYEEAAEVLGVPVGTIRSRVSRAREQLVAALDLRATEDDTARHLDLAEPERDVRRPGTG